MVFLAMGALWALRLSSLLYIASGASAGKDGIVGFGIPLYEDLCCQACHDSLSSLWLNCTTFETMDGMGGMDMGGMDSMSSDDSMPMPMTSDECRASNVPWLQTMASCIRTKCTADSYPADKQEQCFSTYAVAGASSPTLQQSLPARPPTVEIAANDTWLNVTSLVNEDLYTSTRGTYKEFARQEYLHSTYSLVVVFATIGICLLCGVLSLATSSLPRVQKSLQTSAIWAKLQANVFLPPTLGSHRLEPVPGRLGYVPGRTVGLFVAILVVLNVVLSAVNFASFQPNIFFFSAGFELCEYVGNRTGVLSLVNMAIAVLFAGRNNILIAMTGWSQSTFLTLHRWTARIATLQVIVHSIVYTAAYFQPAYAGASAYAAKAAEPFYYWGIIATITMCLAAGTAILPIRAMFYESFLGLHIVLVVLTLVGCWYHLVPHFGLDFGYQVWLYIAFAFWSGERFVRLAKVAYYNRLTGSDAVIEAIPGCGGDVLQLTVYPRVVSGVGPGQHSFVYFPGFIGRFWESHPFSVAAWSDGTARTVAASVSPSATESQSKDAMDRTSHGRPHLRFMMRVRSGATATLQRRVASAAQGSCAVSAYVEGLYAGHRISMGSLQTADTVMCVIGGIGITNALGYLQAYATSRGGSNGSSKRGVMRKTRRFILAWSAREVALIDHVRRAYLEVGPIATAADSIEYSLHCTGANFTETPPSPTERDAESADRFPKEGLANTTTAIPTTIRAGRMDIGAVVRSSLESGLQTVVLACGPGAMTDETTKHVIDCVEEGFRVDVIEDAYTW